MPNPAFVKEVGNYTTGTSDSNHVIAISNAPATNNHLVLVAIMAGGRTLTSVTDSQSNTWQVDTTLANGTNHGIGIASCRVVNALSTSDTITMTWSNTGVAAAVVNEYSDLATSSWKDKDSNSAQGSQTPVESGLTATTTDAIELLVGGVAHAATPSFTPDTVSPVWNTRGTQASSSFVRTIRSFDRVVTSTGQYEMAGDLSSAQTNTGGIVTYKGTGAAAQEVTPGLLGGASIFAPTRIDQTVSPGLIGGASILAPTVAQGAFQPELVQTDAFQADAPAGGGPQTVDAGLIDQTGQVFGPRVDQEVTPGVLGGASIFAPRVDQAVTPGLIDQSGVTFAPQVNLAVTPGLIDQSGVVFAFTRIDQTVSVGVVGGAAIFAPQVDQQVTVGLIDQTGQALAPDVQFSVNPDIIDQSGVVFAPTRIDQEALPGVLGGAQVYTVRVDQEVVVGLIDQSGQVFAFVRIDQEVTPPVLGGGVVFALARVDQEVTAGLIDQSGVTFAPDVQFTVNVGLIDQTGQAFAPTRIDQEVTPGVVGGGQTFAPRVDQVVTPGLIDQSGQTFAPQVDLSITVGVVGGASIFAPEVQSAATVDPAFQGDAFQNDAFQVLVAVYPGLIDQSGQVFAPRVDLTVLPGVLGGGQAFAPQVDLSLSVGLIDQSGVTFAPRIDQEVYPTLLGGAQVFAPDVTGAGAQTVEVGLIDQSGQALAPTRIDQTVSVGLIDQSGQVFAPTRIDQEAQPGILGGGLVFAPQVDLSIAVGLIDQSGQALAPVRIDLTVEPGLVGGAQVFAPTVQGGVAPAPPAGGVPRRPVLPPPRPAQRLSLETIYATTRVLAPLVWADDELVVLGLDDEALIGV